jgi:protein arginine N-methyltransferase 1
MVGDAVRVDNYHAAISRHVKPGDVVVDLGTGTGLLSLFAAQQKPRKIYALDRSNIIDLARHIARHNNVDIEFVFVDSRDFAPNEKVDVILHEQIQDELFGESMMTTVLDLKRRILGPNGRILPARFDFFLEPVTLNDDYRVPYLWENGTVHGVDFGFLKSDVDLRTYKAADYGVRWVAASALDHFLCEPEPVFSFDMNEMTSEDELPSVVESSKKVTQPGKMDGLLIYFRTIFDDDIHFDTSPLSTNTHWGTRLLRTEITNQAEGDEISFRVDLGDIRDTATWSVSMR